MVACERHNLAPQKSSQKISSDFANMLIEKTIVLHFMRFYRDDPQSAIGSRNPYVGYEGLRQVD